MKLPLGGNESFRSNQFLHRQIELQEQLRSRLGMRTDLPLRRGLAESGRSSEEDLLRANFFLMQLLDQISLVLCFDRLVFETIDPVYPRPGSEPLALRISQDVPGRYQVKPWPFDSEQIELQIPVRRIPERIYEDDAELCQAYEAASIEMIPAAIHGGFGHFGRPRGGGAAEDGTLRIRIAHFHSKSLLVLPHKRYDASMRKFTTRGFCLGILLAAVGCSSTHNYDVMVTNRLTEPVTVWMTKSEGRTEWDGILRRNTGWARWEQAAQRLSHPSRGNGRGEDIGQFRFWRAGGRPCLSFTVARFDARHGPRDDQPA